MKWVDNAATTNNGRLASFVQGLCGDDGSECKDDEFIVLGSGERISTVVAGMDGEAVQVMSKRWLLFYTVILLVVLGLMFARSSTLRVPLRKAADTTSVARVADETHTDNGFASEKTDATATINHQISQAVTLEATSMCDVPSHHPDSELVSSTQPIAISENGTSSIKESSTVSAVFQEDNLREQGKQIAQNMALIMSEFEATMEKEGYSVSQSDALAIASQRLQSMESMHMSQAKEARQYMYDSQQRKMDRILAERRHSSFVDAHDQDKDWYQKLENARDRCIRGILPSMQKSCVASLVCRAIYYQLTVRPSYSDWDGLAWGALQNTVRERAGSMFVFGDGNFDTAKEGQFCGGSWLAFPCLMLLFSHWLVDAVSLIFAVLAFAVSQYVLPAEFKHLVRTGLVLALLFWTLSPLVSWKSQCFAQLSFWTLSQLLCQAMFDRSVRRLAQSSSCPNSQDLVAHLTRFDAVGRSLTVCACCFSLAFQWAMG